MRQAGKCLDGTTILPWSRGRPLAWDVMVPDTYANAHVVNTAREAGAAANHATTNKNTKYSQLSNTHVFVPVAIETEGTWQHQAVELVQEIGRRTAIITGDVRESTFLFQQLFVALQYRGGMRSHFKTRSQPCITLCNPLFHFLDVLVPTGFVPVGQKIIIIKPISIAPWCPRIQRCK